MKRLRGYVWKEHSNITLLTTVGVLKLLRFLGWPKNINNFTQIYGR